MCPDCRNEVISNNKCTRCGKPLTHIDDDVSTTFDMDRYERLKAEQNQMDDPDGLWDLEEEEEYDEDDEDIIGEINSSEFFDDSTDYVDDDPDDDYEE